MIIWIWKYNFLTNFGEVLFCDASLDCKQYLDNGRILLNIILWNIIDDWSVVQYLDNGWFGAKWEMRHYQNQW